MKDEDTKQTTTVRVGPTILVTFTEDEAKEMRDIAEETGTLGESLMHVASDIPSPRAPWSPDQIADSMEKDRNRLATLASRLLELLPEQSSASSR